VSKIPKVTFWFWLIKMMISGADVAWPDYLFRHLGTVIMSCMIVLAAAAAMVAQFRADRYRPWIYWPATVAVSVAGTEAANWPHAELHLSYAVPSVVCFLVLTALLAWWRLSEKTLSLRSIRTGRREAFYWAAALAAFALGSALGHLGINTGQASGAWVWPTATCIIAFAWWRLRLSAAVAFWSGYVVTRPLGAQIAGWLSAHHDASRVGVWPVSAGLAFIVVILVTYLAVTHRDVLDQAA
jgi:uncharacterized membrane-anchored protein